MMLTLAWLTVSLPFVNSARQSVQQTKTSSVPANQEDDNDNPFANTTEEKAPGSGNTIAEEYLHDHYSCEHYITVPSAEYKVEHVSTYIAFHGELISPPPDVC